MKLLVNRPISFRDEVGMKAKIQKKKIRGKNTVFTAKEYLHLCSISLQDIIPECTFFSLLKICLLFPPNSCYALHIGIMKYTIIKRGV